MWDDLKATDIWIFFNVQVFTPTSELCRTGAVTTIKTLVRSSTLQKCFLIAECVLHQLLIFYLHRVEILSFVPKVL